MVRKLKHSTATRALKHWLTQDVLHLTLFSDAGW